MKTTRFIWLALIAASLVPLAGAEEIVTNRFTASFRFGLNISARFKGSAVGLPAPGSPRTTPRGDSYNYDDGFVLTDVSGNEGGQTWYWGYDNSATYPAGQISDGVAFPANTVLLSRSVPVGTFSSAKVEDDPHLGFEVMYNRHLAAHENFKFGFECALNYLSISMRDSRPISGSLMRPTDAYPYTPGTTPPTASPASPYQGTYDGGGSGTGGFLLGDSPVATSTMTVPNGFTISGRRNLDADLWGGRLGPYFDFPIYDNMNFWISGGLALGLLSADVSWTESLSLPGPVTVPLTGGGGDSDVLWGWYVSANFSYDVSERWSAAASLQFQDLGTYSHDFGGRTVELDLSQSIFISVGVSRKF